MSLINIIDKLKEKVLELENNNIQVKNTDTLKKENISLKKELTKIKKTLEDLNEKNDNLEKELTELKKVSMVGLLTKRLDEKTKEINLLNKKLSFNNTERLRLSQEKKEKKEDKVTNIIEEYSSDKNDEYLSENYETIIFDDIKYIKESDTKKIYFITDNGSKGKYAGKETKKGKIKLKLK